MAAPARARAKEAKSILVVDDDRPTRHLISRLLKTAQFSVAEAADGAEALRQLKRKRFDLMLLDVWMPVMTGLELLAQLRGQSQAPRVIVMTTDDTPETILTAVREQAHRYMNKPVEAAELLEMVNDTLARPAGSRDITVISARPNWVELLVPCEIEAADRIQNFMMKLKGDLPEKVRAAVGQAFHELLLNAIEWGGQFDPNRQVRIAYVRTRRMLLYRIADPGKGFRFENLPHSAVSNPADKPFEHATVREEKGIRPGGFGILMTKASVDELVYNEAQNEVIFVKYLDGSGE